MLLHGVLQPILVRPRPNDSGMSSSPTPDDYAKSLGKASERVAERTADAAKREAVAQRAAQDETRRERERAFWEQRLRPALLSAIAVPAFACGLFAGLREGTCRDTTA
jgi:predicted acyl esterase